VAGGHDNIIFVTCTILILTSSDLSVAQCETRPWKWTRKS